MTGVLFAIVVPAEDMMPMVAALYGAEGVILGLVFHLLHSLAFDVAFGVLVSLQPLARAGRDLISGAILGGLPGLAVWVVFAAFVMPAWIGAVTEMDSHRPSPSSGCGPVTVAAGPVPSSLTATVDGPGGPRLRLALVAVRVFAQGPPPERSPHPSLDGGDGSEVDSRGAL